MRSTPLYIGEEEEFALAHVLFVFYKMREGEDKVYVPLGTYFGMYFS